MTLGSSGCEGPRSGCGVFSGSEPKEVRNLSGESFGSGVCGLRRVAGTAGG